MRSGSETNIFGGPIARDGGRGLDWLALSIAAMYLAVFKWVCIPQVVQQGMKVTCVFFVILFIVTNVRTRSLAHPIIPFCAVVVISTVAGYLGGYVGIDDCVDAFFYGICLYCLAILVGHCSDSGRMGTLLDVLFWMTAVYCAVSAVFVALVGVADGPLLYYFAGNKFSTSYYFILLAALCYARMSRAGCSRRATALCTLALSLLALAVSRHVYCSTAAVMSAFVGILALLPPRVQGALSRPGVLLTCLVGTGIALVLLDVVLSNPMVRYLVIDVLGEDLTLTGRDLIYQQLPSLIAESPLFGYGYGNSAVIMEVGYGNAQNSVMETIVNYGLLGLAGILYAVVALAKGPHCEWSWGVLLVVYAMILGSVVEITFNYYFFLGLFIVGADGPVSRSVKGAETGLLRSSGASRAARFRMVER